MKNPNRHFAVALAFSSLVLIPTAARADDLVPTFDFIAPGWLQPLSTSMTPFWSAAGLPETGTNYYSSGAASSSSPYWERFDPSSPLYQAWFGTYVVDDFQFASEWNHPVVRVQDIPNSVQRVAALATVDQIAWLAGYQDPTPYASVEPSSIVVVPAADGYFFLSMQMNTHSDVGGSIPEFPWYPPYATNASSVDPYASVTANSVALFKFIPSKNELVVIYASAAQWTTLDGAKHATPPWVSAEQLAMMLSTKIPD